MKLKKGDLFKLGSWIGNTKEEKKKFVLTTILFLAILFMAYGYWQQTKIINDIQENPCDYVETIQTRCVLKFTRGLSNEDINYNGTENKNGSETDTNFTLVNGSKIS